VRLHILCCFSDLLFFFWIGWFDLPEHSVGELTTRLEEDSEISSNVTGLQQGQRIQTFTCLVSGMIVALYYSWQVGLIAIACIPLIIGASVIRAKYGKREGNTSVTEGNYVSPATLLERSFHDIVILQAYGNQEKAPDLYAASLEPDVEFKKKKSLMDGLSFGASQFSVFGTFALIFWAGIKLMLNGKLGFTDFFVALLAVMFSSFGAGQTGADFSARKRGVEAAGRLFSISDGDVEDDMDSFSSNGDKPSSLDGNIEFKNCHFATHFQAMEINPVVLMGTLSSRTVTLLTRHARIHPYIMGSALILQLIRLLRSLASLGVESPLHFNSCYVSIV
jgi:ATP-binding cassette subfamily B (MDR/TAP) protein 1